MGRYGFELAKQKDCEVTGISLSKNQINYCKKKAKELGLDNQVSFELADYREIKENMIEFIQWVCSSMLVENFIINFLNQ